MNVCASRLGDQRYATRSTASARWPARIPTPAMVARFPAINRARKPANKISRPRGACPDTITSPPSAARSNAMGLGSTRSSTNTEVAIIGGRGEAGGKGVNEGRMEHWRQPHRRAAPAWLHGNLHLPAAGRGRPDPRRGHSDLGRPPTIRASAPVTRLALHDIGRRAIRSRSPRWRGAGGVPAVVRRTKASFPALEPSHALAHVAKDRRRTCPRDHIICMNMCRGRGDKDIYTVAKALGWDMFGGLNRVSGHHAPASNRSGFSSTSSGTIFSARARVAARFTRGATPSSWACRKTARRNSTHPPQ